MVTLPPKTPPGSFGLIEASPRQAFDPGYEAEYDPAEHPLSEHAGLAAGLLGATEHRPEEHNRSIDETLSLPAPIAVSVAPELSNHTDGEPLSTRPTDRAPSVGPLRWLPFGLVRVLQTPSGRLLAGVSASVLALGAVVWATSHSRSATPIAAVPQFRGPASLARLADPTLTVALKLHGLPPGAQVSVDGESTGDEIVLPRSERSYEVTVEALGKQPWHLSYVPQTDSVVEVAMADVTQLQSVTKDAGPTQTKLKRGAPVPKPRPKLKPLRTPDF
jgi:hypothetical protein